MNTIELLNRFRDIGVQLRVVEGTIEYDVPASVARIHPEVKNMLIELRNHKLEAVKVLMYTDTFFDTYTYDSKMDLGELAANDPFFNELFKSWYERKGKKKAQ